ncbi:MAG: branched-chain amino acid ABC transporter permease [Proteobacteria bacterium]|nr:branched-chain amino acid ABC transporter permease [Pseudomonadota bacterium]
MNFITGYTGMLNLGSAGFMAIGAYSYAIFTCDIYPFQFNFFQGCLIAILFGAISGYFIWLPVIRLSGDYLAIVTLGFGEIVKDVIRNLDIVTKGAQGINPLPPPVFLNIVFDAASYRPWYYLVLTTLFLLILLNNLLYHSFIGRRWIALREDELASKCMGNNTSLDKLASFCLGSAISALAGAIWASFLGSSGEPGNYDFQISVVALCIVIIGGLGSISGAILGAFVVVGFNSIILEKISSYLLQSGIIDSSSVFLSPSNWKYMIFGFLLILMMRYRPEGFLSRVAK